MRIIRSLILVLLVLCLAGVLTACGIASSTPSTPAQTAADGTKSTPFPFPNGKTTTPATQDKSTQPAAKTGVAGTYYLYADGKMYGDAWIRLDENNGWEIGDSEETYESGSYERDGAALTFYHLLDQDTVVWASAILADGKMTLVEHESVVTFYTRDKAPASAPWVTINGETSPATTEPVATWGWPETSLPAPETEHVTDPSGAGTYYLYEDGELTTDVWIRLDGKGGWQIGGEGTHPASGWYERNGNELTFFYDDEDVVMLVPGILEDGKLSLINPESGIVHSVLYIRDKAPTTEPVTNLETEPTPETEPVIDPSGAGTYYLYEDGELTTDVWIRLDGDNRWELGEWEESSSGWYVRDGIELTLCYDFEGEEVLGTGILKDGKLTLMTHEPFVFYIRGKAPATEPVTYYPYEHHELNPEIWICLDGENGWEAYDEGFLYGWYGRDGDELTFYVSDGVEEEFFCNGILGDGTLTLIDPESGTTVTLWNKAPITEPTCEHEWDEDDEYVVDVEPDCYNEGSMSIHCKKCGEPVPETEVVLPPQHTPEARYYVQRTPTCTASGVKVRYCAVCGMEIERVLIEKLPHTPGKDYVVDDQPDCFNDGSKSIHCTVCDAIIPETVVPLPRQHIPEACYVVETEPTCCTEGLKVLYCAYCGDILEEVPIDVNPDAHRIDEWIVTDPVDMFHPNGSRTGVCIYCDETFTEGITFAPTVEAFTSATENAYTTPKVYFDDIRGDAHFYPTDEDLLGNDLLVEFSLLWNETMLNFDGNASPYIDGCFDEGKPFYYFSPVSDCKISDSRFPGSFEWMGSFKTPISDGEVQTPATMCGVSDYYADYPNIGGADPENPEWGWHRLGFRYHLELLEGRTGADLKDYVGTVTGYLDGVAIFKLSTGEEGLQTWGSLLFNVYSDGEGEIVYTEENNYVIPIKIYRAKAKSDTTVFFAYADVIVSCGKDFVMPVRRVDNPEAATLKVAEGVEIDAPIYFTLQHEHVPGKDYVVDKEPTTTSVGYKSLHCTVCGKSIPETVVVIPALEESACEHEWEEYYVIDEAPDCFNEGSKSIHCKKCGESIPETVVVLPRQHIPEADYEIILEPTCCTEGLRGLYCACCGEILEEVPIEIDPDAHVIIEWETVEPTLLNPTGSKTGICELCGEKIVGEIDEEPTFEPYIYNSKVRNGKYADSASYAVGKMAADIRGDKHFAPSEEDDDGNDLWFEYSFLWNDTLYNWDVKESYAEIKMFGFRNTDNWSNHREFYYLYTRDNNDGFKTSGDCPFAGHFDYATYLEGCTPPENCADDLSYLGKNLNDQPIGRYGSGWTVDIDGKAASPYIFDSEWQTEGGWHRLGFRYHQEAAIDGGIVVYSAYTELYIDGVLVWRVHSNANTLKNKGVLLWTAEIDPEDPEKLIYAENDALRIEMRFDSVANSTNAVYIAVDDPIWTCGDGFVRAVERIEDPEPATLTLDEGVEVSAAIYFRAVEE